MVCRRMMMTLPAVVGAAVASAGSTASSVKAAVNAGLCTDADASCVPSSASSAYGKPADQAEVWLLQVAVGRADAARMKVPDQEQEHEEHEAADEGEDEMEHRPMINMTHAWEKLKAAARVDKLKTAMESLKNSNITEQVREDVRQVISSLPIVEHMKQIFSHQWGNASKIAEAEDLHSSLMEVTAESAEAGELRRQLQELPPISNETVADMQHQVASMWDELQGNGFSFPHLDGLTAHAHDVMKQLFHTVKNSTWADGATEAVHGLVEDIKARASSHEAPESQEVPESHEVSE